ncbi:hypothetical protein S40285_01717 [Stachybotrys chlorohalonatus IBT 40285]|uniref:Pet127-domain-containing protein n=1 Tax=Stachybotrys chlorohalonatus (strain IBT 40285) TaxID=1283841 RepID=A0A084QDS6_STAC4|nr:hypothetical protein S40285_01717 [Stachybotrys chlorohalonata IBT 40285]
MLRIRCGHASSGGLVIRANARRARFTSRDLRLPTCTPPNVGSTIGSLRWSSQAPPKGVDLENLRKQLASETGRGQRGVGKDDSTKARRRKRGTRTDTEKRRKGSRPKKGKAGQNKTTKLHEEEESPSGKPRHWLLSTPKASSSRITRGDSGASTGHWLTLQDKLRERHEEDHSAVQPNPDPATLDLAAVYVGLTHESPEHGPSPQMDKAPSTTAKATSKKSSTRKRIVSKTKSTTVKNATSRTFATGDISFTPVHVEEQPVIPGLSYQLDRVLFNPGVYQLQDPRSRVFNFDPYLASIMPVHEFDFNALKSYITSSQDVVLRQLSASHGSKYCGSTSSLSALLSHFHYLLSAWRPPSFKHISHSLIPESSNFTILSRAPAAAFAHHADGVYAIDSSKEFDSASILSLLGRSMEKLLTLPKKDFEKYRKDNSHLVSEEERNATEAYHYTQVEDFMLRSQLDAYDPRLPGTGIFDLKTRAVVSVRMHSTQHEKGSGYEIRTLHGQWESFEREYLDMIRSVFLKYSLQVRMGRMDGIFVAYHNTERIFGFQYISLSEMDEALHHTSDRRLGDEEFKASVKLFNELLNKATARFPGRTLRLHVETRDTKVPRMYFFAEPVTEEEMRRLQESRKPEIQEIENKLLGLNREDPQSVPVEQASEPQDDGSANVFDATDSEHDAVWSELLTAVGSAMDHDRGITHVRQAVSIALHQHGLLHDKSPMQCEGWIETLLEALTLQLRHGQYAEEAIIEEAEEVVDENEALDERVPSPTTDDANNTTPSLVEGNSEICAQKTENDSTGEAVPSSEEDIAVETVIPPTEDEHDAMEGETEADNGQSDKTSIPDVVGIANMIHKVIMSIGDPSPKQRAFERVLAELVNESKSTATEQRARTDPDSQGTVTAPNHGQDGVETVENLEPRNEGELLGLAVTIRNIVNGKRVERPILRELRNGEEPFEWKVEYDAVEMKPELAWSCYGKVKQRRKVAFESDRDTRSSPFFANLRELSQKGKQYRAEKTAQESGKAPRVAWHVGSPAEHVEN